MKEGTLYDVIIIGSGPAGYAAATYNSRAFLKTLLVAGSQVGGQLTTTTEIENYPGFSAGIQGPALMEEMKKQVERFGTEVKIQDVTRIDLSHQPFTIWSGVDSYKGKSVIIATGASAKYLGLPSEETYKGKGVSACATCDGFFFRGKEVVVIGGGDTAMEEALFLTRFATKVTIIHRRDEFRASPIMVERAKKNGKITFLLSQETLEIVGETSVGGIRLKDKKTGKESVYPTQGVFLAIGHKPNTEFLAGQVTLDEKGYVVLTKPASSLDPQTKTNIDGVFAAGDCVDPRYRQAIVAAGMGAMAAIDVQRWLEEKE